MISGYHNRGTWQADSELEMMAVLRALGLDELRQAQRLIKREIHHREAAGPELHELSQADKALFRNA